MTRSLVLLTMILGAQARVATANETTATTSEVRTVLMAFGGDVLPGLWVLGQEAGWSVPLPYVADDACTARLHDISPAPLPKIEHSEHMTAGTAALMLPRPRYTGSHTYRISFQCETSKVADLLVHLDPSAEERQSWFEAVPRRLASR